MERSLRMTEGLTTRSARHGARARTTHGDEEAVWKPAASETETASATALALALATAETVTEIGTGTVGTGIE
jgi:hypothetical protein